MDQDGKSWMLERFGIRPGRGGAKAKQNPVGIQARNSSWEEKAADDEVQKSDISSSSQGVIEKESLGPLLLEVGVEIPNSWRNQDTQGGEYGGEKRRECGWEAPNPGGINGFEAFSLWKGLEKELWLRLELGFENQH
ncbi:hypothetical protein WISP_38890 [Willisornis vidua]|uniref:Uncharacterized protein n=1 Tax=Willisornis vidua TaxID=1566151 RepID=A0ABQ9DN96_9PASS|nr:hypothetical protein WISP_38890 [Willisornis vidua]